MFVIEESFFFLEFLIYQVVGDIVNFLILDTRDFVSAFKNCNTRTNQQYVLFRERFVNKVRNKIFDQRES